MGIYDSMAQKGNAIISAVPQVANGGSFAQKQQMKANPVMQGRPAMGQAFGQSNSNQGAMSGAAAGLANAYGQMKPNPMTGARPAMNPAVVGQNGSRTQIQAKQKAMKDQQAAQQTAQGLGPSDPVQQLQQTLSAQKGMKTPYDQQQESLAQQTQPAQSPMQAAAEQMRGYEGPDLGSQDPRELARVGGQTQLYGTTGQSGLQAPPFEGNHPGSNSFQSMMEQYGGQRPDIVRGGIGPSAELFGGQPLQEYAGAGMQNPAAPVQMDENGLEPRRGAR